MLVVHQPSPQPSAATHRVDAAWFYTDTAHTFDAKSGLAGLTGIINVGTFRSKLHCTYDPRLPPTLQLSPLPEAPPSTESAGTTTSMTEPSMRAPIAEPSSVAALVALFSAAAKKEPFSTAPGANPSRAAGTAKASLHALIATPRARGQAACSASENTWEKVTLRDDRTSWQPVDPEYLMRETNELTSDWHTALAQQSVRNRLSAS